MAGNESLPVAGTYVIAADALEFHPRFPFDAGRGYVVRFDGGRLPTARAGAVVTRTIDMPGAPARAATTVTGVSPGSDVWPENLLRFYVHFSAPMSRATALGFLKLEDAAGREVTDAFLPLDVDLWNEDRTRFTVFFDPGRVKRGIRPNVELGRAMHAGRRYAIVIDAAWPDDAGRPLASGYRHAFTAGPAEERAIAPEAWQIAAPRAGTSDPLVVTFPWALDRALLQRTIGVAGADHVAVEGDVTIAAGEREWRFTPRGPWRSGRYQLVVLSLLEDPAGNRVGRPFEIEMFQKRQETAERVVLTVDVK